MPALHPSTDGQVRERFAPIRPQAHKAPEQSKQKSAAPQPEARNLQGVRILPMSLILNSRAFPRGNLRIQCKP